MTSRAAERNQHLLARWRSGEGINYLEEKEPAKVGIAGGDAPEAVLAHQDRRVRDQRHDGAGVGNDHRGRPIPFRSSSDRSLRSRRPLCAAPRLRGTLLRP